MLVNDRQDLIHKATGWMLRYAGDKDRERLLSFLDEHAATMLRTLLRYAIEHLDKQTAGILLESEEGCVKTGHDWEPIPQPCQGCTLLTARTRNNPNVSQ